MSELRSLKIFPFLPLCFFLIVFPSIFIPTSAYTLPDQYFINCGSDSSPLVYGKNFSGDVKPNMFSLSSSYNSPFEDPNSSGTVGVLYQSARIFRKRSWYEFDIEQNGTFVVRFHFLPFPSLGNVSAARFSVLASGFLLLSRFTVVKMNLSPHTEEFLMTVPAGKFKIYFVPDGDNYFAFVNAMEVFIAPPKFIPDFAQDHVNRQGAKGDRFDINLLSFPLRVIYRVNVGGPNIMPNNDTLLRSWILDDIYLFNRDAMNNSVFHGNKPPYNSAGATEFDAPEFVYKTARKIDNLLNITWRLNVTKGAKHLLRVHFCDIVSDTPNEVLRFHLYISSQFDYIIKPSYVVSQQPTAPFYIDYLVDSDDSGFINVSVGPDNDPSYPRIAFLNGVEIMQLIEDRSDSAADNARLFIIIGSAVGGTIIVIVILILVLYLKRRKSKAVEAVVRPSALLHEGSPHGESRDQIVTGEPFVELNLGLKLHLSEIHQATRNFDTELMIGEGGFGKVYKGTLRNGTKVAVKRSEPGSHGQGLPEFQTEIMVLSKIRHNHLVRLIGYCYESNEMILVYELMEKGTLRDHLYKIESTPSSTLSWDQRVKICVGVAEGIHYLHTGLSGAIIHRDIKSTNILLDENYVAKVADFGISRSSPRDETHVSTHFVKGTWGYLDPEYVGCSRFTQKTDVYSFGVVLLEVLCARPAVDRSLSEDQVSLAQWGMSWIRKGQLEEIVDPLLKGKINPDSLRKFGEIVEKCLQASGADRPNMRDVLWDLKYSLKLQHTGTPREDGTTDVGLPMSVIQRLPSYSVSIDEDESCSFTDTSDQVNAGEVLALLKIDQEAR